MSWRNFTNHRSETKAVKAALRKAGIPFTKVGHGTGTAWAWLEIYLGNQANHKLYGQQTLSLAKSITGRTGEYNGDILILGQ